MKQLLCLVLLFSWWLSHGFAQSNGEPFLSPSGHSDWLKVKPGLSLSAAEVVSRYKGALGLTSADEWVLLRVESDPLGMAHYRYRQYHRGVPVCGAQLIVHEHLGRVQTLNGKWVRNLSLSAVHPTLSAADALQRALQSVPARRYLWQSARAEALVKRLRNNPRATFYPQPQLVIATSALSERVTAPRLCWRIELHVEEPVGRYEILIDAHDGQVIDKVDLICHQNTPGVAKTRYSGERPIVTERLPDGRYRLFETTRGNGVETYNMQRGTNFDAAVDFLDDDNYWNNANAFKDDAATDAHWGAEMTYDYFWYVHQHAGLDGRDFPLLSYVHYGTAYDNAFWNGAWASYGDGSGPRNPFTSLDIVAHEFAHGITEFSAGLRYRNESGALNEAFSDIFGAVVRFWAKPENAGWRIGNEITANGTPFRDMAWPKNQGHPHTYRGQFWFTGTGDNGGVHTNSGVKNYWFYLLTQGGSGINDNGHTYSVTPIGMERAAQIAFRTLKYYLTPLSTFSDAREASLQAAEELFGRCSEAFLAVADAWHAVGVGTPIFAGDIELVRIWQPVPLSCGLTGEEPISVLLRYRNCENALAPGDAIPLAYRIDDGPVVRDTLIVETGAAYGDELRFTFSIPPTALSQPGHYTLSVWVEAAADRYRVNDTATLALQNLPYSADVRLMGSLWQPAGCFLKQEPLSVRIGYFGCEPLPQGTALSVGYRFADSGLLSEEVAYTPRTLFTGDTFVYTFSQPAYLAEPGLYAYETWVRWAADSVANNDTLGRSILHLPPRLYGDTLTFESGTLSPDTLYLQPGQKSQILLSPQAAKTGTWGLLITGGDFDAERLQGKVAAPRQENVWDVNPQFRSRVCFCADLSNLSLAELRFELRQSFSLYYLRTLGQHAPFGSALRILVDGQPTGNTFKPLTVGADPWRTQTVSLKHALGKPVELCFEAHTGVGTHVDTFPNSFGDRVLLDNIVITGQTVTHSPTAALTSTRTYLTPNPAAEWSVLAVEQAETGDIWNIRLTDALGRLLVERQVEVNGNTLHLPLNVRSLEPGLYYVHVYHHRYSQTLRLQVQR